MDRRSWYMMAYDIADPRRLAKIHRQIKKDGIAAQKSVFFVHGTEKDIESLMDRIGNIMKMNEDDLRAYPITKPADIWTNVPNPLAEIPTVYFGNEKRVTVPTKKKPEVKGEKTRWLKKMFKYINNS
ncbi:CRISPR-associated endonuclease Cas2 [Desulfonema limicola]|uniref:CRISPR-associated endoribonuclease Cas2 n=1 Tax=Desulfonema limicola TaxID=45656 RepID=A0A975BAK7_9BACT|nr:CRISPR-associated endonuclease Cas2 [Desulfonema limicola]QTA81767.1 CRISPR-associated endonuclease Cas2 [Desulfonema limicola]